MADAGATFEFVRSATIVRFGLAALLIELTPGPNMGYLAVVSAQRGRLAGLIVVAGVALGLACYLAATVLGIAEGALNHPFVYEALRWCGVAYMLWLAMEAWLGSPAYVEEQPAPDRLRLFGRGLLANLLNVKAAIFYAVILPAFIDVARGRVAAQALTLGVIHLVVATAVHVGIVLVAAGTLARLSQRGTRRAGRIYGLGLALVAVWLAWSTQRR